ncbi:MAG: SRPBCC domain-containing protein [Thermoplasmata archaeon]
MSSPNFSVAYAVSQTPEEVFSAVNDVRGWWTGEPGAKGTTDKLGAEWTYQFKALHYTKQRITEFVPGKKVVWLVLDSKLSFVKDQTEWNGSKITFEIAKRGDKTELRFTHVGLVPEFECYGDCSSAWGYYVKGPLRALISKKGKIRVSARAKGKTKKAARPKSSAKRSN